MSDVSTKAFKEVLGKSKCYFGNFEELAEELDGVTVVDEDGKIIMDLKATVAVINVVWSKVKETAMECEGKQIEVNLPDNIWGIVLGSALAGIGIRL